MHFLRPQHQITITITICVKSELQRKKSLHVHLSRESERHKREIQIARLTTNFLSPFTLAICLPLLLPRVRRIRMPFAQQQQNNNKTKQTITHIHDPRYIYAWGRPDDSPFFLFLPKSNSFLHSYRQFLLQVEVCVVGWEIQTVETGGTGLALDLSGGIATRFQSGK